MSADQFDKGDDDPGPPDARRSADAGRLGDQPPPASAEINAEPAEPRSRQEYADDMRHQDEDSPSEPIPDPDTQESRHSDSEHPEAASLEEEQSDGSSAEEPQAQDQPRVPDDPEESAEEPSNPDDQPAEPANPEDVHNGTTDEDDTSSFGQDDDITELNRDARQVDDKPRPLTDREWVEHLGEVRDGLEKARDAGLRTNHLHTIDGKGQIWTEERDLLHDSIIEKFYAEAAEVPCDFKAIIAGGLGGAGKTTVLTEHAGIDLRQYLMINPDNFKEELARRGMLPEIEGLSPMEASDLAHEESSYLAKRLARQAQTEGKNVIWDITMSSQDSTMGRINDLREAGYAHLDGIFVDIPIEISIQRTDSRHREGHENYRSGVGLGGRFVPPEVIRDQEDSEWSCKNRKTYEAVKVNFSTWTIYDNSVNHQPATLIDSSNREHQ